MEKFEKTLQTEGKYLISLLRAAIRGEAPAPVPTELDWNRLFSIAQKHMVDATVYQTVASLGSCPKELLSKWKRQADSALRTELLFDAEREQLFKQFDEHKIKYIPLKGILIKKFYPRKGMRRFADNDILFDKKMRRLMRKIMTANGYKAGEYGSVEDSYTKPPVFNFEMHKKLFKRGQYAKYFNDIWSRALKDGVGCAYRMTDEDFYLFNLAHFYKHFTERGAGIRFYVDLWLILQNLTLDEKYIAEVLCTTHIDKFDRQAREIAESWFGDCPRNIPEETYKFILTSGVFGTLEREMEVQVKEDGMTLFRLCFPSFGEMCERFPFLRYLPFLLPFLWVYRGVRAIFSKHKRTKVRLVAKYRAEQKTDTKNSTEKKNNG